MLEKWYGILSRIGLRDEHLWWEKQITVKINLITAVGFINVILTSLFFIATNNFYFIQECIVVLIVAPFVIILNYKKGYIYALYLFYFIGFYLFAILSLKMGHASYMVLYYFPLIITMVQMLARKETFVHFIILLSLCFLSVFVIFVGYKYGWLYKPSGTDTSVLRNFNLLLSFLTTISFILLLTRESIAQEVIIRKTLSEKEILLSEVFHRVKNNMNIITSLINLRMHQSKSEEARVALEDCRNRVFSMALVHQKTYDNKSISNLNFKEYLIDLINDLKNTLIDSDEISIEINAEEIYFELNYAIPCGLILNELVTNSIKHAQQPGKKLSLNIGLKKSNDTIHFQYNDNGPGLTSDPLVELNSLGIELIKSLSNQIDGKFSFESKGHFSYNLMFKSTYVN